MPPKATATAAKRSKGSSARHSATSHVQAGWRKVGDRLIYARSRSEANYARYLEWLCTRGDIRSWKHEPKIFWFEGIRRGCTNYKPDFLVVENGGREVWHEVKGWLDDKSRVKIKRMGKYYPDVVLLVITQDAYGKLARQVGALVPEWE